LRLSKAPGPIEDQLRANKARFTFDGRDIQRVSINVGIRTIGENIARGRHGVIFANGQEVVGRHRPVIGAVDGNGDVVCRAVICQHAYCINQGVSDTKRLNSRIIIVEPVDPHLTVRIAYAAIGAEVLVVEWGLQEIVFNRVVRCVRIINRDCGIRNNCPFDRVDIVLGDGARQWARYYRCIVFASHINKHCAIGRSAGCICDREVDDYWADSLVCSEELII
jgi:hypothetical protein